MRQKLVRIQISHQELLRKMLIFLHIFFIPVLIIRFISLNFHQSLNWEILLLFFKTVTKILRKTRKSVSILSNISKIFERFIFRQISSFMDSYLSKQQYWFRKGYSPQYCLLVMLEKWKYAVDKGKCFGALLIDLPEAFDCLSHELLIAKLHADGIDVPALKLVQSYLSNRKQRTKINAMYSSWEEILFGVPQGSILDPLLFNIYLRDLFWTMHETDSASYADDNTPYALGDSIDDVIKSLEDDCINLFK